ncbi:argininosuccinate lyase, partial [Poseidonibacter sp.]|uniref:argininosuccinate lyase n=1 Tax=Poseidonibacter sp. TaxID=2321188 RepID=UPI003C750F07
MSNQQNNQILKNTNAQILDEFNASIMFDKELYSQDIKGSIAHSQMLCEQGVLTKDEQESIENGLLQVKKEIESGEFTFSLEYEDIHMAVENRLTQIIGEPGKRLHTARSRNDQVATDFRLYVQEKTLSIKEQLKTLVETFVDVASKHTETLIPGMTHLQHAQPLNFGYHLLAYANMFKRDLQRFESSYERNNYSPLGSAALAGTPHNINRQSTSDKLGFTAPTAHAMDTVSDRDFALEIL